MRPQFQADANFDRGILRGLVRREPSIDFRTAQEILPDGLPDPQVLELAASDDRILVTHDIKTMPGHFARFISRSGASPGVFLMPQSVPIAAAIDELIMIWAASDHDEWRDQLIWLPL